MLNLGIPKSSLQRIRSRNPNEQERGGENDEDIVNKIFRRKGIRREREAVRTLGPPKEVFPEQRAGRRWQRKMLHEFRVPGWFPRGLARVSVVQCGEQTGAAAIIMH